jgi:uncharacterized cupredoxin-like copper-binding protein
LFKHYALFKIVALVAVALVSALAATACGPSAVTRDVQVTADEFSIKLNNASVPAGKVTFRVANKGTIEHELVLLKTDLAPTALKMRDNEDKVNEEVSATNVGEVEDIGSGATKSGTFDLTPGKYVLICNVVNHYRAGMTTAFEVK